MITYDPRYDDFTVDSILVNILNGSKDKKIVAVVTASAAECQYMMDRVSSRLRARCIPIDVKVTHFSIRILEHNVILKFVNRVERVRGCSIDTVYVRDHVYLFCYGSPELRDLIYCVGAQCRGNITHI